MSPGITSDPPPYTCRPTSDRAIVIRREDSGKAGVWLVAELLDGKQVSAVIEAPVHYCHFSIVLGTRCALWFRHSRVYIPLSDVEPICQRFGIAPPSTPAPIPAASRDGNCIDIDDGGPEATGSISSAASALHDDAVLAGDDSAVAVIATPAPPGSGELNPAPDSADAAGAGDSVQEVRS